MEFLAYCPFCESKVTAYTILEGDELKRALEANATIEVMHVATISSGGEVADGDHGWNLIGHESDNLLKKIHVDRGL